MSETYWRCTDKLAKEVQALDRSIKAHVKLCNEYAKSQGGTEAAIGTSWATLHFLGIRFASEPDKKYYYQEKGRSYWTPRAGTPARKKLQSLMTDSPGAQVSKLIGFEQFQDGWITPGVHKIKGQTYILLQGKFKGHPEMDRISDLQYEALTAKAERLK